MKNIGGNGTVIIDSGFLQNPINELLFRKATDDEVRTFIHDISVLPKPLSPVCVYLRRNDAEEAIAYAKKAKGDGWANRVDELLKQSGCENFFQRRFQLELELLPTVEHIVCEIDNDNWSEAKSQIERYFQSISMKQ